MLFVDIGQMTVVAVQYLTNHVVVGYIHVLAGLDLHQMEKLSVALNRLDHVFADALVVTDSLTCQTAKHEDITGFRKFFTVDVTLQGMNHPLTFFFVFAVLFCQRLHLLIVAHVKGGHILQTCHRDIDVVHLFPVCTPLLAHEVVARRQV